MMHQLLQELGRDLVHQESPKEPWERSRLWHHEESYDVLKQEKGTAKIEGLFLDMKMIESYASHGASSFTVEKFGDDLGSKMGARPFLHRVCNIFSWIWCVALDMSYSNLEHLWKNPKLLRSLKFLIMRCCRELVSVGRFDWFPLLERLILAGCVSLVEVCESIGNCDRLILLDVSECSKLKKLPRSIRRLKNLRTVSIAGCLNHGELPVGTKDMESPDVLKANNVNIESQVSSSSVIVDPRSLKCFTISLPDSLVRLSLKNNNLSNESFPADFGSLSMLKILQLDGNQIDALPVCVSGLSRLMALSLFECCKLKTVLCAPRTIKYLYVHDCVSLEKVTFHPETLSYSSPIVYYRDTKALTEIEGMLKKQAISEIDEEMLCRFGWINRQHVKDDKFLTMSGLLKAQGKTLVVQMIYGHVVFSTYFLGNRLPDWITHISCSPELHFTLPSSGKSCRIRGLNLCIVATMVSSTNSVIFPRTKITNLTKDNSCKRYGPRRWVGYEDGDIVWLSHWMFENNEFEDGDEVCVNVSFGFRVYIDVKEFGISIVYDDDEDDGNEREDPLADYRSWKLGIGDDLLN